MATEPNASPDHLLADLRIFGIRLGLDSCRRILETLGSPHRTTPVVLVAGTNGKGSTAALLAAMATVAGYRTGLYTSPHLEQVEERIRVNGAAISPSDLIRCLEQVLAAAGTSNDAPPTYFEALTIAALLHFAAESVDLAVLEVGLGGRLDATNVCEPELSVIAEIALDHQAHLGESLGEIAAEKAGILRPRVPTVTWVSAKEALWEVRRVAATLGSPLTDAREGSEILSDNDGGADFQVVTPEATYALRIALPGEHQRRNVSLALRAAEELSRLGWHRLNRDALEKGARRCVWPGRLELVLLADGRRLLLEAAHNVHGAEQLHRFLKCLAGPVDVLFGVLDDKDGAGMIRALGDLPRRWTLTSPPGKRAVDPHTLPKPGGTAAVELNPERALDLALDGLQRSGDGTLVVYGSLFLVGFVRERLRRLFGVPVAAAEISTVLPAEKLPDES